ncbi:FGGY family carbohydrate kinase, partial [Escherichia coli]|nr:FGGY family carbohydrate kinase [Escherichia coli]
MTSYMLGIDIGTTSTKAVLFTEQGEVIQHENIGYPLYTPDISTAEQNPEEIFSAVLQSIANIMENHSDKNLSFISFSSAMHS